MCAVLGKQYSTCLNEDFQSTALCFEVLKHGVTFLSMQYPCVLEIVLNSRFVGHEYIYVTITLCMFILLLFLGPF